MCSALPSKLFYPFFNHNKYINKCRSSILIPKIIYLNNSVTIIKCPKYIPRQQRAADHDTYAKIKRRKLLHVSTKLASTTILRHGIQVPRGKTAGLSSVYYLEIQKGHGFCTHYYKILFCETLENRLEGGLNF